MFRQRLNASKQTGSTSRLTSTSAKPRTVTRVQVHISLQRAIIIGSATFVGGIIATSALGFGYYHYSGTRNKVNQAVEIMNGIERHVNSVTVVVEDIGTYVGKRKRELDQTTAPVGKAIEDALGAVERQLGAVFNPRRKLE
ncbi:hypothetical protein CPB83DRAFT_906818 [Crepidotus variabilis]|uniref:Uncharacterized protein n=1 Tax=Crepidotus variabilis TaxID=179855 RepID=A0A9P6EG91_9AGAR|nr:hypothetical protein CPB83DRAFT_906818 [Crepidotus variabilis]